MRVTSAVTSMPRAFAQRITSTEPAVETWQTCRREPTCSARSTSRAMIDSSATAGHPVRPSSPERAPSFIWAPSVSRVLRVLGDDAVERLHVLECAAHEQRVGDAEAVVGEDAHVRARRGHRAELGELLALQARR